MGNQPTCVRWSPAERVDRVHRADRADGGGVALVAGLAPHDPRLRLLACRTIFRP
jgi:hypothetical protein